MKGLLLLSDGIDSPVAGHLMKKQGLELGFLNMINDSSEESRNKVRKIAKVLDGELIEEDHVGFQEKVRKNCNARMQCILCKRQMYRKAEQIALREGYDYIVTGDNLGQVASQTLDNLYIIDQAVKMPVLRPLLGFDKDQTVRIAREIGTYEISSLPGPSCEYVPKSPLTTVQIDKIIEEESKWTH